ncbi:MAG: hypothetical protein ACYSSI_12990 [Planctomycetota bacterium]
MIKEIRFLRGLLIALIISFIVIAAINLVTIYEIKSGIMEQSKETSSIKKEQIFQRTHLFRMSNDFYGNCEQCHDSREKGGDR